MRPHRGQDSRFVASAGEIGAVFASYDAGMSAAGRRTARSYLYVPADRADRLAGATGRGADALILDLEDAVPVDRKEVARANIDQWLSSQQRPGCELWVRINSTTPEVDIDVAVTSEVMGVVVPKAEPALLAEVDSLITGREHLLDLEPGAVGVFALIETAAGLLSAADLARAPRVWHLGLGEADLAAELRLRPTAAREELSPLRLQLVLVSAAAGIAAPVGPTATDFRDQAALRRSTEALLRLGFRARTAIHPAQLAVINDVFSPTAEEVAKARRLVAAYDDAVRSGAGVLTDEDGRMVDVAVVRSAREVLARADPSGPDQAR